MSSSSPVRTRQPKAATRSRILQRAYEMYLAGELVPGDERLASVLDSLGYTTGAGYQIWANQKAFREDLSVFIAENIEYASLRPLAGEIVELAAQNLPFERHVLTAGDRYVRAFLQREEFFITLRFFAMSDDRPDEITHALRSAYQRSTWETAELFAAALQRFQRRLKPSLEMSDLTAAICAALEGYALRARVQPEAISDSIESHGGEHHVFSLVFLAITEAFTEPIPQ